LSGGLLEKVDRIREGAINGGFMGLRWGCYRARWDGLEDVTQSGADKTGWSLLSTV
jgi:hypothetical protein